jgi:hypothetical protein
VGIEGRWRKGKKYMQRSEYVQEIHAEICICARNACRDLNMYKKYMQRSVYVQEMHAEICICGALRSDGDDADNDNNRFNVKRSLPAMQECGIC